MSHLSGLLTMVPLTITPDVVNDFLTKRKNHRLEVASKSGSAANPHLVAPLSGDWTGTSKESRMSGRGEEIRYRLTFKPCGAVEGSATSAEGKFNIKGVYNMLKGTVQWRQTSQHAASSSEYGQKGSAEFVGDLILANHPFEQGAIVGTFLTTGGGYYHVELVDPQTAMQPTHAKPVLPLPTLLTGGCTPKGAGTPARFYSSSNNRLKEADIDAKPADKVKFALTEYMTY
eukprot:gnl/MRDRNA2_/MRDRNA2_86924_c0_seq1.p1 gnl/MRDRNA2_/MRDRNA2_86924_c0~~gnl/MRDRNA2_/MRDRNA2_86924_c0_seq1.p1  ORF type:complete len:230 (+),score=37.87 gnl/MRDRNA2_/MRDRNA2_86924_c0_seq1:76-765(+)